MTREDKELLLKDLSARLIYGVIVDIKYNKEHGSSDRLRICSEGCLTLNTDLLGLAIEGEIHLKPYLRPLSSMTEKEWEEYNNLMFHSERYADDYAADFDWLNTHHFDYRQLIEKGLAIEAPEDMYK